MSASNEDGARGLAAQHFRIPMAVSFGGDPWRQRDLVGAEAGGRLRPLPPGMAIPVRELRDIGVTPYEAGLEARKPFWRA